MKVAVCVKFPFGEINPFDACALEAALSLSDAEITLISMSPLSVLPALKELTRYSKVSRAILLFGPEFAGSDTLATSYALSLLLKRISPDMVFFGSRSVDSDTAQVPAQTAQRLGFSFYPSVMRLSDNEVVTRQGSFKLNLPAALSFERINVLRFPSFRQKPLEAEVLSASDLNADKSLTGLEGSPTRVLNYVKTEGKTRKCRFIGKEEFFPLIESLKDVRKKRFEIRESTEKTSLALAIGAGAEEYANAIAEKVIYFPFLSAEEAVQKIKEHSPKAVIFASSPENKTVAAFVAASLGLGLCADCTNLRAENGKIIATRPVNSGRDYADIISRTSPLLATVLCYSDTDGVIVSAGRGCDKETATKLADKINAALCCSRAAVDEGKFPYDCQVGLTGKAVAPDVYIALGISGAVQHVCGMENSGTVIAVNPDKSARIFDFADYGVTEKAENLL